ncbi:oxygen-dependent coproporphyrinogen oxidase [Bordetella sp. N]|uniref:oxygen-dependent coproporphyrinogen oxidase n=1 Tax=Bordetella sp. N TaxID=1746199 RepID=UPI0009E92B18|nr:oxygen-dependent coproporphyrinogen oxidase [Bordetella sp. N]
MDTEAVKTYFLELQHRIVSALEGFDGKAFMVDPWHRPATDPLCGHGRSCVIEDGDFFERGGVNFSHVQGDTLPRAIVDQRPGLKGRGFEAMGVSLVLHPRNPYCPTVHMNVRLFVATGGAVDQAPVYWFGGGMDLTPVYGNENDARHFHATCRDALEPFGDDLYPSFKTWCDDYFYLPHRNEARGIGGVFFDDFNDLGFQQDFAMTRAVGDAFLAAYLPIVTVRRHMPYGERERDFQQFRRGRYVEFNLIIDRGTLFGLQSRGRTESILMSMPPIAKWRYDWRPEAHSEEARLTEVFLPRRDWLASTPVAAQPPQSRSAPESSRKAILRHSTAGLPS